MNKSQFHDFERKWIYMTKNATFADEYMESMCKGWAFQAYMGFTQELMEKQEMLDHYREILVEEGSVDEEEYQSEMGKLKNMIHELSDQLEIVHEKYILRDIHNGNAKNSAEV